MKMKKHKKDSLTKDHCKQTALCARFKNAKCSNLSLSGPNLLVDLEIQQLSFKQKMIKSKNIYHVFKEL